MRTERLPPQGQHVKEENTLIEDSLEPQETEGVEKGLALGLDWPQCEGNPETVSTELSWKPGQGVGPNYGSLCEGELRGGSSRMADPSELTEPRAQSLEVFRLSSVTYCPCGGMQTLDREHGAQK